MKKSLLKRFINNLREDIPIQIVNLIVFILDFFYKATPYQPQSQKNILIVRTDLLGDFIIWLNALILIAKNFQKQNYKVILLGNEIWMPLADRTNAFDVLIPLNRKKYFKDFAYRKDILNQINQYEIDFLFQSAYSRDFAVADSVTRNVRAKNKIAFTRISEAEYSIWNFLSNSWYTKLIKPNSQNKFEFYRVKEFLSELNLPIEKYSTELSEHFEYKPAEKKYFVLLPGANEKRRCLEPEKFAELITEIKNKTGWECYLCGSKGEIELGQKIQSHLTFDCKNLIGETSLLELGSVLINSEFVIGNETGTVHYATALNKNTACILGGGHFGRFMPYEKGVSENSILPNALYKKMDCFNCHWRCIYTDKKNEVVPCISQLSSDFILTQINPVLIKAS